MLEEERADLAFISESHLLKEDVDKLKNTQYQVLSSSSAQDRTKGVMILARRNLGASILGKGGDSDGRITYVKTEIENHKIAFMAIYALNEYDAEFYAKLTNITQELEGFKLIIGSDFNAVWDYTVDQSSGKEINKHATTALKGWAEEFALDDVWRMHNPQSDDFSFFSAVHLSTSRIDFIFASKGLLQNVNCYMKRIAPYDHKPVICRAYLSLSGDKKY